MTASTSARLTKAERTRQLLLSAALRIISRKGYSSATVDEIVREAGVSKGVAYYHFKSKADMASDILSKGLCDLAADFEKITETSPDATAALGDMLELFASELYDNREFSRFLMTELWRDGRVWSIEMRENIQALIDIIAAQLSRGQSEGNLHIDNDPEFSAVSLVGMAITTAMYYAGTEGEPLLDKQRFTQQIRNFARHALG